MVPRTLFVVEIVTTFSGVPRGNSSARDSLFARRCDEVDAPRHSVLMKKRSSIYYSGYGEASNGEH
jgi:hypothetical protein